MVICLAAAGVFFTASPTAEHMLTTHEKTAQPSEDEIQRHLAVGNLVLGPLLQPSPSPSHGDIPPVADWHTDPSISPALRKELKRKDTYVKNVLTPLIEQDPQLDVIQPVNTQNDPVNPPGALLVVDTAKEGCVSQFYVNLSEAKHTHTIHISTWGKRKYYDGNIYGRAAYTHGMLSHAESDDNFGEEYPADDPKKAVSIINEITDTKCKVDR